MTEMPHKAPLPLLLRPQVVMAARQALGLIDLDAALNEDQISKAFRARAKQVHPDMPGGCARALTKLIEARAELLDHIGHDKTYLDHTNYSPPLPQTYSPQDTVTPIIRPLSISITQAFFGGPIQFEDDEHELNLPAGLRAGEVYRVPPSALGHKTRFFRIDIDGDAHSRIWGDDLWMTAFVPMSLFYTGGYYSLTTPKGKQKLSIPADTEQKSSLRIKGMGLPPTNCAPEGDLIVRLEVQKGHNAHPYGEAVPSEASAKLRRFQTSWVGR
jgi:curved DNA-binding protein